MLDPVRALPVNLLRSARSASSRDPACDTTPAPSAVTVIFGRVVVACTSKVPFLPVVLDLRQAQFPLTEGHFRSPTPGHADKIVKRRGQRTNRLNHDFAEALSSGPAPPGAPAGARD